MGADEPPKSSPFLHPGSASSPSALAVLHLRRDQLLPVFLSDDPSTDSGYAEGQVTNTRFGSYPHSTLIGLQWGSQVVASQVDTGSRGRREGTRGSKKRKGQEAANKQAPAKKLKLEDEVEPMHDSASGGGEPDAHAATGEAFHPNGESQQQQQQQQQHPLPKQPSAAASGFCHIVPPTPEAWTVSLPHRTQVVYTPDYSFIIQKMRIRPGAVVLEAGAGSGSFTHAAARAAFNGHPTDPPQKRQRQKQQGHVYSYEYHAARAEQLRSEIRTHGLADIITITHRDVYTAGFLLPDSPPSTSTSTSPNATHIFLDLPSPWHALPHLTRAATQSTTPAAQPTPLDPSREVHICIFLPCIEQVHRAVAALRAHAWVEISMHVLAHRRVDVRRERVGLAYHGVKRQGAGAGVLNVSPATVAEACRRLKDVERHGRRFQNRLAGAGAEGASSGAESRGERGAAVESEGVGVGEEDGGEPNVPMFRQGRLVHRTEPEIRTHTSYLVFAVLPRAWE